MKEVRVHIPSDDIEDDDALKKRIKTGIINILNHCGLKSILIRHSHYRILPILICY